MAAKGLFQCSLFVFSKQQAFCRDIPTRFVKPIVCYNQTRGKRYERPLKDRPKPWFVKVKSQRDDKDLTAENKEFLKEAAIEQYKNNPSPLQNEPWPRNKWTPNTIRTGVLGVKIGVIPQWKKDGTKIFCQLIQIVDNHVIRYTPPEEFQKSAGFYPLWRKNIGSVVVGSMSCTPFNYSKAYHNLFSEAGVPPKRKLTRFWITPDAAIQPGTPLSVNHFRVGDYVDISGKSRYHGFQGVVKRFGFKGGRATHGTTKSHRRPGSMSAGLQKGMHKGKKMPGEMGGNWSKSRGLKIWRINTKYNILYTNGGVPGPHHGFVRIYDCMVHKHASTRLDKSQDPVPMPTFYSDDIEEDPVEDLFDEELFDFSDKSIHYSEEKESR